MALYIYIAWITITHTLSSVSGLCACMLILILHKDSESRWETNAGFGFQAQIFDNQSYSGMGISWEAVQKSAKTKYENQYEWSMKDDMVKVFYMRTMNKDVKQLACYKCACRC